jgi:large subunit ribosomal protein L15
MELNTLRPAIGASKNRKRIGRGVGSGHGKTSTKGHKGQKARSGGSIKPGFEGGQMPMQRRLPKRGFTPLDKVQFAIVNVGQLDVFESGAVVDVVALMQKGIISSVKDGLKILAKGSLTKALTIKASKFSAAAKELITAAGGTAEEL